MLEYELWSTDSKWVKQLRLRQWMESNRRWEMRRAKKKGPQAVFQLKAEWESERIEKRQSAEDNERARAERRAEFKRAKSGPPAPPNEQPHAIAWDIGDDWEV